MISSTCITNWTWFFFFLQDCSTVAPTDELAAFFTHELCLWTLLKQHILYVFCLHQPCNSSYLMQTFTSVVLGFIYCSLCVMEWLTDPVEILTKDNSSCWWCSALSLHGEWDNISVFRNSQTSGMMAKVHININIQHVYCEWINEIRMVVVDGLEGMCAVTSQEAFMLMFDWRRDLSLF